METTHTFFLTVILVSVPTYIVADDRDGCPTNLPRDQYLKVHGGKCYQFAVHRHLSWPKAEGDCRTRGGHLVKVENMAEEEFIMGNLRSYNFRGQGVWIGLTRPRDGASFTWVTGEPIQFHYWAPGQPGSGSSRRRRLLIGNIQLPTGLPSLHLPKVFHEDCVLLKYTDSGHWHDYPCEHLDLIGLVPENFPYVCEYPLIDKNPDSVYTTLINTQPSKPNAALLTSRVKTTSITQAPTSNLPTTNSATVVTDAAATETATTATSTHKPTEVVVIG